MTLEQAQAALADANQTHRCDTASVANATDRWRTSGLESHGRTVDHMLAQWRVSRAAVTRAQATVDALTPCLGCGELGCTGMARDCDDHLTGADERADRAAQRAA